MFVVLVGGDTQQRSEFYQEVMTSWALPHVVWVNDRRSFYYIADLFVNFGGQVTIPSGKKSITWSGNNQETIERTYKTLGLE
jgi:hypothetical protein